MTLIKSFFLSIFVFFAPIHFVLLMVGFLILFDTVTGIMASKKRGEKITSRRMSQIIVKMTIYHLAILTLYLVDLALINEFTVEYLGLGISYLSTKIGGLMIAFVEFTSIKENVEESLGINISNKFKEMVKFIKDFIKELRGIQNQK